MNNLYQQLINKCMKVIFYLWLMIIIKMIDFYAKVQNILMYI